MQQFLTSETFVCLSGDNKNNPESCKYNLNCKEISLLITWHYLAQPLLRSRGKSYSPLRKVPFVVRCPPHNPSHNMLSYYLSVCVLHCMSVSFLFVSWYFFFFTPSLPSPFPSHPLSVPLVPWGDVSPVTNKLMWKSNKRLCGLSGFLSPQAKETLIKEPRGAAGHGVHSTSGQTQPAAASLTQRAGYRANYQVLGTAEEFG